MKNGCLLCMFLLLSAFSFANIRLPAVIASNMVLQQQSTVKLWGWGDPGERIHITTSWNGRTDSVTGTRDAKWEISVPTPAAGGPYTITLKGYNTIVLENVLIGEVWVCSGQSNMEMCGNWGLPDISAELPTCATNNIHFFHIARATSAYPQEDCSAQWKACDSTELKSFSAAGYFFAKRLNTALNVPIGMIESAWGGTPAEVWTPAELVDKDSLLKKGEAAQKPSRGWPYIPGYCYNGMIAPITNYTIAGALWYQGEGNTAYPPTYGRLFATMIGAWRQAWNKPFSFYYVQIAPFTYGAGNSGGLIREQQANCLSLENTGMVVISDLVNDTANIHPKDKHDVGIRLANWALAQTYHKDGIAYKSPMYKSVDFKGSKAIVTIDAGAGSLLLKGAPVRELSVAGEDKVFYPAEVKIEGSRLIASSAQVKQPVAVRYQFDNAGIGNICSKEGWPMATFRTDDW